MLRWFLARRDSPQKAHARVCAHLAACGLPYVRDVVIPDAVGGYTQIPHLLLTPEGVLLLESQYFTGILHGSALTKQWIRFDGKQRHEFDNPLHHQQGLADTLNTLIQGERVGVGVKTCFIVCGPARFAKRIPDRVLVESHLPPFLAAYARPISARLWAVWKVLLSRVACDPVAPFGARPPAPAAAPGLSSA